MIGHRLTTEVATQEASGVRNEDRREFVEVFG